MKQSVLYRVSLGIVASLMLTAAANAAPVAMLQFGSFETREDAQGRIETMKKKHAGMIGKLPTSIREIKLPPDNLTVYRTQAGPVTTRIQAESICAQLASNGDECYVVETAMLPNAPAATEVDTASMPAPASPAVKVPAPVMAAKANIPTMIPDNEKPVIKLIPWRDLSKTDDVSSQMAESLATVVPPASSSIDSAMQRAIADQEQAALAPKLEMAPAPLKDQTSFWARLNPFSDDEETAPSEEDRAPTPDAAEVASAANALPSPSIIAPVVSTTVPATALTGIGQRRAEAAPAAPAASMDVPVPVVNAAPLAAPVVTASASAGVGQGNVQVEEAKRVPLSNLNPPSLASLQKPAGPAVIPRPTADLLPSATLGKKTRWAQLGEFENTQKALAFWEQYRIANPDFPVVRIRVISSYQRAQRGDESKWLRVGPFAKEGFITNLCSSLGEDGPRCGTVTDMGVASSINRIPGLLPGSRYQR